MELDFKEWVIEEGWFGWKRAIPLFAAGVLGVHPGIFSGIGKQIFAPSRPSPIKIAPEEIGVRIPDSPQKGFAFSIKGYGPVSENDINIRSIRSSKGGWSDVGLKGLLQAVDVKKQIAGTLNGQSQFGYSSLPPGTAVDDSRKEEIPNKIVTVILDDWPIYADTPFDPIHISGTVKLDLRKGEAWIAPSKIKEHLAFQTQIL